MSQVWFKTTEGGRVRVTIELNETLVNLIIFVVVAWVIVRIIEAYLEYA